ncbi:MAG TPA: DUF2508 family protein [Candidatus Merdenecus merdavium]|nr:DUF2508 family protein [Candidatus Merdenecus merdavium]
MIFKKKKPDPKSELLKELQAVQEDLDQAFSDFEKADDVEMIDSSIFEINSVIKKYNYILRNINSDDKIT